VDVAKGDKGLLAVGKRVGAAVTIDSDGQFDMSRFLPWAAIAFGFLFLLTGAVRKWHNGSGHGSWFVDAAWSVLWPVYTIGKIAFVFLLIYAAYHYLVEKPRNPGRPKP
jgi:hypothetical protein